MALHTSGDLAGDDYLPYKIIMDGFDLDDEDDDEEDEDDDNDWD